MGDDAFSEYVAKQMQRIRLQETIDWIPVEERLTAVGVLAVVDGRVMVATYFSDGEWLECECDRELRPDETVTHWAAMPRGPR